jgi:uncharacterized membrane protein YuzA (DUF378 family)
MKRAFQPVDLRRSSRLSSKGPGHGLGMNSRTLARALVVVGGLNWGLVGLAKFDLVATVTGNRFGGTNAATRLIYLAVGAAAAAEAAAMVRELQS